MNSHSSDSTDWRVPAAVLAVGSFAMGTDSFVIAGILPQLARDLGTAVASTGFVVTVFTLSYAVAAPVLATITSHLPRRPLILTAMGLFIVANLCSAVAPSLPLLLATRVAAGIGAAAYTPTASAAAAALAGPAHRGRAMSVILGGLTLGTVFGVPVGTWVAVHTGWRASLIYVAAVAALAWLGLSMILPTLPRPPHVGARERLAVLGRPRVAGGIVVMALATTASIMVYTYIAEILRATVGATASALPLLLVAWGLGGAFGAFGSGWLVDRIGARRTMTLALVCLTLTLAAMPAARSVPVAVAVLLFNGCAGWAMSTPSNHNLTSQLPQLPTVAISYNSSGIYAGQALGAALGAVLLDHGASPTRLCVVAGLIAVLTLVLWLSTTRTGVGSTTHQSA